MKTVLITGTSSGIGKETAKYFQKNGWNVAATMRRPELENELTLLPNVKCFKLDVCDDESINSAIEEIIRTFGEIDVVVNNAGYYLVGAFEASTNDQIQRHFNTNLFGLMNVIKKILPHFRKNRNGIIINVSSVAGRIGIPLQSLYGATKWAVEGLSESLQFELRSFNIKIKLIEPGVINTDFRSRSIDIIENQSLTVYNSYVNTVIPKLLEIGDKASHPKLVAGIIYKAATDQKNKFRYKVGEWSNLLLFFKSIFSNTMYVKLLASFYEK